METPEDWQLPASHVDNRRRSAASLRGQIGAYRLHATHDRRETTAAARAKFLSRFEVEVDPEGKLSAEERARRASYARRAFFAALAYQRHQAAQKRAGRASTAFERNRAFTAPVAATPTALGAALLPAGREPTRRRGKEKPRLLQESAAKEERDGSTHPPPV